MRKRGYFFTLDVLIALIIMVVGFIMIWSSISTRPAVAQPYFLAQDMITYMSSSTVLDVSSNSYITWLFENQNITQDENTVLEQIAEFYYINASFEARNIGEISQHEGLTEIMKNFTRVLLENATPYQYSFEFIFSDEVLFSQQSPVSKKQEDSDNLISIKTITSATIGKETITPPYLVEVRVWQ